MSEISEMPAAHAAGEQTFRLIYRSRSTIPAGTKDAELAQILRKSRANNKGRGITGALLMYDEWFAQVLEGPEAAVRQLYDCIKTDPRHDSVSVPEERQVPARAFARWAMADVGEHGEADIPMLATTTGLAEGGAWKTATPEQNEVLDVLRDQTRGYGR